MTEDITPELLLSAYARGMFPMANSRDDPDLVWLSPNERGIFPLDGFHISRSLARRLHRGDLIYRTDGDFSAVVAACAARRETWISHRIAGLYRQLHDLGHAHSFEVWADGKMTGGVYGVALGAAFFGESMFSAARDGSKCALAGLVSHLKNRGFRLFDTQFLTPHLHSLGAVEIPRAEYLDRLEAALVLPASFGPPDHWAASAVIGKGRA